MSETREADDELTPEVNVFGEPVIRGSHGKWLPGTRPNPLGRGGKKPTVLDETVALAHKAKNRRRIARAWVETMAETGTAPGNRARADFSDRVYGLPKQTLVLEQADSPLLGFLMRHNAQLPYVEGESRTLPAPDA